MARRRKSPVVGNEGMLGISLFMGGETTPSRAVVQSAGHGIRLKAQLLKEEFARFGPMMHLVAALHPGADHADGADRGVQSAPFGRPAIVPMAAAEPGSSASNELSMTQELIANMLGVRREGVTEAAGKLQDAGLIHYRRGRITVLDRPGLEARSCECYQVVKTEFDRLLPYAKA